MNTVSAAEIIEDVACLMGWRADDLDEQQFKDIRNALSYALQTVWEDRTTWWPEVMEEQRIAVENYYDSCEAPASGTVVYYPEADVYYQTIENLVGTDPAAYNSTTGEWEANAGWYECTTELGDDADEWDPEATYEEGDTAWFDNELYLALDAVPALSSPNSAPALWQQLIVLEPRIEADGDGTPDNGTRPNIAEVKSINRYQPSSYGDCQPYEFTRRGDNWYVYDLDQNTVWIEYRRLCPPLVGDDYDATKSYQAVTNLYD